VLRTVYTGYFAGRVGGVLLLSEKHMDRNPVAPRVVYRHSRMLGTDCAMATYQHRLAFDFCVTIRHRHGNFFMGARDRLRIFVAGIIDNRLVYAYKTRGTHHEH